MQQFAKFLQYSLELHRNCWSLLRNKLEYKSIKLDYMNLKKLTLKKKDSNQFTIHFVFRKSIVLAKFILEKFYIIYFRSICFVAGRQDTFITFDLVVKVSN